MKKFLIFILTAALVVALCMAVLVAAEAAEPVGNSDKLTARQVEVHAAAELLRELGVAEDDPAIAALQEEWWRCEVRLHPLYTEEEVVMMAKVLWGEAGGVKSVTEQACVAWTVCNHVDEPSLCVRSIKAALITPGRFYGYRSGNPVTEELLWLARDVLERWTMERLGYTGPGRVLPSDYIYFSGDGQHNYFRNAYRGGVTWDYSLPSPYES